MFRRFHHLTPLTQNNNSPLACPKTLETMTSRSSAMHLPSAVRRALRRIPSFGAFLQVASGIASCPAELLARDFRLGAEQTGTLVLWENVLPLLRAHTPKLSAYATIAEDILAERRASFARRVRYRLRSLVQTRVRAPVKELKELHDDLLRKRSEAMARASDQGAPPSFVLSVFDASTYDSPDFPRLEARIGAHLAALNYFRKVFESNNDWFLNVAWESPGERERWLRNRAIFDVYGCRDRAWVRRESPGKVFDVVPEMNAFVYYAKKDMAQSRDGDTDTLWKLVSDLQCAWCRESERAQSMPQIAALFKLRDVNRLLDEVNCDVGALLILPTASDAHVQLLRELMCKPVKRQGTIYPSLVHMLLRDMRRLLLLEEEKQKAKEEERRLSAEKAEGTDRKNVARVPEQGGERGEGSGGVRENPGGGGDAKVPEPLLVRRDSGSSDGWEEDKEEDHDSKLSDSDSDSDLDWYLNNSDCGSWVGQ